ncbi:MAG: MFS transporter [Victivallales bacterium]|nr:MFS transporter [Victivallales bacterium]
MDQEVKARVRKARKSFIAIAISYFMGLFNDNFYKEAALLLAVLQGRTMLQAVAAGGFTLAYMFAAGYGGWMADRYSKGNVIIAAKGVEVVAMIIGAAGIWTGNWYLVIMMVSIMGAQSAIFSPSMNGSIPELYPDEYVQTANTYVRILSTSAIFIGMALAGYLIDFKEPSWADIPQGVLLVGICVLAAAFIGFFVAFGAPRIGAHDCDAKFPWLGPVESVREILLLRRDKILSLCVCGNVYLWSIATVLTLLVVNLGIGQFGVSSTATAGIKIMFLMGIAVGGVVSNIVAKGKAFYRVFIPTIYAMGGLLVLVGIAPYVLHGRLSLGVVVGLLVCVGIAGGMDLIPLESIIQIRPHPAMKGRVIAAANFAVFAGMAMGTGVMALLNLIEFDPTTSLGIVGAITLVFASWLGSRLKRLEIPND